MELATAGKVPEARDKITNPSRMEPAKFIDYCGSCHRPPASDGSVVNWRDHWNVCHQPMYLSESACFKQSDNLTCVTCHDPHDRVVRNEPNFYAERCLACHGPDSTTPAASPAEVCSQPEPGGCVSCHMPDVKPQDNLTFHNHWIGVYGSDDRLRPQRRN